jgi:dihydrofolate reductase
MISLIWAQTKSGVIGKNNTLPWNIHEEMKHFVNYTKGKKILMGRKTWDSLSKKPLPNRENFVASTNANFNLNEFENTFVVNNLNEFLLNYTDSDEELVVIGGASLYNTAISFAKKLVISIIKEDYDGDTKISPINFEEFNLMSEQDFKEFSIKVYERK